MKKKASKAKPNPKMKRQLVAQLRAKQAKEKKGPGFEMNEEELKQQASRPQPEVASLPCPDCDEPLSPMNRSILQDGRVIHIGCKAPKKTTERPRAEKEAEPILSGLPKHRNVKPPKPAPPFKSEFGDIIPMGDYAGRTCLQLRRDAATVTFINTGDQFGMHLNYEPKERFDARFKPLEKYPVKKAVEHFVKCAVDYGATQDVLDWLGRVVTLKEEQIMAAKKKLAGASNGNGKGVKKSSGPKKPGSGSRIRELILKATPTEKILSIIRKEFPGSKAKASDVSWNRGKLKNDGVKIPEPKG